MDMNGGETELRKRFEKLKVPDKTHSQSRSSSRRSSLGSTSDNELLAFTSAEEFKIRAEELGQKLTEKFELSFQDMIDNLSVEMQTSKKKKKYLHLNEYNTDGSKKFVARESLLTELFEIQHIQSIYNVFIAVLFVFLLNTFIYDYFQYGRVWNHFLNLSWAFGKSTNLIGWWLYMQIYTLAIFPLFTLFLSNQLSNTKLPIVIWTLAYLIYILIFFYFPVNAVFVEDFPPATTIILMAEQVRFIMKVHAFVRVNTGKLQTYLEKKRKMKKDADEIEEFEYPGFSQYIYFLFIPTLIYRDSYPMTPYIRWNFVVINLLQVFGCVAYTYFVFARFCVPAFENTGKEKGNLRVLLLSAFSCMVPGMLVLLVAFFCILHSWMNAFAEMTRFADRMFYRDWWNAKSYSSYYRMWNVVVHDWLYAYIYKDFYHFFGNQGRAATTVFFISAVVHEYILVIAFRFFFPALLIMFGGVGFLFFFVKPRKGSRNPIWNIYVWTSLCMGSGILMTLYSVEWYASRNCSREFNSWVDFVLPYSFDSSCVTWEWKDIENFTLSK